MSARDGQIDELIFERLIKKSICYCEIQMRLLPLLTNS